MRHRSWMVPTLTSLLLACGSPEGPSTATGATAGAGGEANAAGTSGTGKPGGAGGGEQAGANPGGAGSGGEAAGQGGTGSAGTSGLCAFTLELGSGRACAVQPSATNGQISDDFGYHALGLPAKVDADTPVYVHLVGSGGDPAKPGSQAFPNETLLRELTSAGVLVLMLAYPNDLPVGVLCKNDLACYEPVRREIIYGQPAEAPYDKLLEVSKPQDILSRMEALVAFLKQFPEGQGLPPALSGAKLDTTRMRVGGHSQGGGHAGILAKDLPFERVCMLSSPIDNNAQGDQHVPWIDGTWATPLEKRRATIHEQDPGFVKAKANLDAMSLIEGTHWKRLTGATSEAHGYTVKGEEDEAVAARAFCIISP